MEQNERKTHFYVFSEGHAFSVDDEVAYGGNLEIWEQDEDGNVLDYLDQTYISDKWGGQEIDFEGKEIFPEFTNGLINIGEFKTYDEAFEAYNLYIEEGTIKISDLFE